MTTPFRLHGIPQEFLDHAKRAVILERVGLAPQSLARGIVEAMAAVPTDEPLGPSADLIRSRPSLASTSSSRS